MLSHRKWNTRRLMGVGFLGLLPLLIGGCPRKELPSSGARVGLSTSSPSPSPSRIASAFNGERALAHARKQIDFGPRPPDTPALAKTREYIINELKSYGLLVTTDEFTASTPEGRKKMTNIIGEIAG